MKLTAERASLVFAFRKCRADLGSKGSRLQKTLTNETKPADKEAKECVSLFVSEKGLMTQP